MPRTRPRRRRSSARGTAGPPRGCAPSTPSPPPTAPCGARRRSSWPPATYQYSILVGDLRVADELNPRTSFIAGPDDPFETEVSEVALADCNAPALAATSTHADGDALVVEAEFAHGADGVGLDPSTLAATLTQAGAPVAVAVTVQATDATHVTARAAGLGAGKYTLALTARDRRGRALGATASGFVATPLAPAALSDTFVYQVMVDRFRAATGPLAAPASPGDRAGGTPRRRARRARRRLLRSPRRHDAVAVAGLHQPERSPRRPRRPPRRALPRLLARGSARRRSRARRRDRARRARRRCARARPPRAPRRRAQPRLRHAPVVPRAFARRARRRRRHHRHQLVQRRPHALRLRRSRLRLGREHGDLLVRALPARSQLAPPRRRRRRHRRSRLVDVALRPRRPARRRRADDAARRQPPHDARGARHDVPRRRRSLRRRRDLHRRRRRRTRRDPRLPRRRARRPAGRLRLSAHVGRA